jgi:ATP-binding cassette, subfamily B (MDR/TAP), member 1
MDFFDAAAPSSQATTLRVISTISDDAYAIQDFLAEKVLISPCTRMQRDTLVF